LLGLRGPKAVSLCPGFLPARFEGGERIRRAGWHRIVHGLLNAILYAKSNFCSSTNIVGGDHESWKNS
jgi:hypothetical protein